MAGVELIDIRKSYGAVEVLHGIDVTIADGEFVALVGPSGCGKSTLLRMIAGLESVTGGTVRIGDNTVNDLPPKKRDIAMVFQTYALYPHMTVGQNMGFSLKLSSHSTAEIDAKVKEAAEILSLTPLLSRKPRQLSGGQRQRVAMGRAIVRDPSVFLFDEPLSNLDAQLRVQMRGEIKALQQRLGTTTVYVTHDQVEAMTMADRIVVMNGGRIEQIGAPLDLYDHPQNEFVARFIGSPSMNMLRGKVVVGPSGSQVALDGGGMFAPSSQIASVEAGQAVTIGIRPEHLTLAADDQPAQLEGTVIVVEPTGAETLINLSVGNQQIIAAVKDRVTAAQGAPIRLSAPSATVHLFDAEKGTILSAG